MRVTTCVCRVIAAITLVILWLGAIPLYGTPFVGCSEIGYFAVTAGCSNWPEFIRGFGVVLICAVVGPAQVYLHYFSLLFLAVVTVLGGFTNINSGEHLEIGGLPDLLDSALFGLPLFVGGVIAFVLYLGVRKYLRMNAGAA